MIAVGLETNHPCSADGLKGGVFQNLLDKTTVRLPVLFQGGYQRPRGIIAKLVAQMFSLLETVRLQGGDAIAQLCELLSLAGRSPPGLQST